MKKKIILVGVCLLLVWVTLITSSWTAGILGMFFYGIPLDWQTVEIEDYYSNETKDLTRWFISDCLYQIRSKKYIAEYIKIVSNPKFARNRQLIVLLLGKLKVESAIPVLIELLEDEDVRLHAIDSLGQIKREEFRCYFERFENSPHYGWRKYARTALKKLDKVKSSTIQ